jgi:hypothetical protein
MYPEMREVLQGVLCILIFGALMGILRPVIEILTDLLFMLVKVPRAVLSNIKSRDGIKALVSGASKDTNSLKQCTFVTDFVFVFCFGIGSILLLYVVCDGSFRLYVLVLSVLSALASYLSLGRYIGIFLGYFSRFFSVCLAFLLYIPIKAVNVVFCHKINTHKRLDKVKK